MKLFHKFLILIISVVVLGLLVLSILNYSMSSKALLESNAQKLQAVVKKTSLALSQYFKEVEDFLVINSDRSKIKTAIRSFENTFETLRLTGKDPKKILQEAFIDKNPYPIGEKYKLFEVPKDYAMQLGLYNAMHKTIHAVMKNFVDKMGFYDIFLVSPDGDVLYTYFKERDFATNLEKGEWKDTNLADLYRILKRSKDNEVHFVDYKPYTPSHGAPAAFAGVKILDRNGKPMGFMIVRLPIDRINSILQERTGLGRTGNTYAVGQDYYMRSDSRFEKESTILRKVVKTPSVEAALRGESGWKIISDYRGVKVLSAFLPFKYKEINWAIIGEIDYAEATEASKRLLNSSVLVLVVIVGISIVIAVLFTRSLVKPIVNFAKVLEKVSEGNLSVEIEISGKDEIADMGRALKKTLEILRTDMKNIQAVSGNLFEFSNSLDDFIRRQTESIRDVAENVENVIQNAQSTSAAVEEVTSGAEEVASSAQSLSNMSQQLSEAASEMSSSADEGRTSLDSVMDTIGEVVGRASEAAELVEEVSKKSRNIGEIVETINSIAEQTNLLALNAAIEAARAGEAGKGFAVVADEIRKLAEESKKATEKIDQILSEIREGVVKAKDATESMVSAVEETREKTHQAMEKFEVIMEKIRDVQTLVDSLAATSEEQSAASQEMSSAMNNAANSVAEITSRIEGVGKRMEELLDQSRELSEKGSSLKEIAERLRELSKKFRI